MNKLFYLLFTTAGIIVIGSFVIHSIESQHPDSIIVRQALVNDAPWPVIPESSSNAEKSDEIPVLPQWLLDQAIDVEEALKEILENRITN